MLRYWRYATNAACVVLFLLFAWANFISWHRTGSPTGLGATLLEGWTAALFLVRRDPLSVSGSTLAWIAAAVGSFAMLLARPAGSGGLAHSVSEPLQLVGVAIAVTSLGALGRSFGIVAANRGVRTAGLYRVVRHPVYLGYLVSWVGYVGENPSVRNTLLLLAGFIGQLIRIREEEHVLLHDTSYRRYTANVRRRLIPYVY
jgi:protein-S-isoprenylcysteine O-methyltransferase Ste14